MLRTITCCEKNTTPVQVEPVLLQAGVSAQIVPDQTNKNADGIISEVAWITIQNTSPTIYVYYCFAGNCDNVTNFDGVLPPYVQLNVPHTKSVFGYAVGGNALIAVSIGRREGGL